MAHTKVLFLAALRLHPEILCLYIVVKIVSRKRLKFICIAVTCIPWYKSIITGVCAKIQIDNQQQSTYYTACMVNNKFAATLVYWSCAWQSVQSMILVVVTRQEIAKLQFNYTGVNSNNVKKCSVGPNYNLSHITYPTPDLPVVIWVIVINVTSNQALTFLFVAVAIAFLVTFTIYLHAAWVRLKFGKIKNNCVGKKSNK